MPARLLEHALRRPYLPFLVFAVTAQLYLALPWHSVSRPGWAAVAAVVFVALCALAALTRRPGMGNLAVLVPVLFFVVLALWRHAAPGAAGVDVIALLPVAWVALFGTMRQVAITIVAYAAALLAPIWLAGAPDYPHSELRPTLVTVVFAVLIAPTAQYLVRQLDSESARLDAVLRAATGHSVIACDLTGTITMFNPGAERMLGWRASEAIGKSMTDLLHDPDELAARAAELKVPPGPAVLTHAVTAAGGLETRDWTYRTRGGAELTVSLAVTGIRNADGVLVGYVGVGTDVTEARETVRTLEGQRGLYRMLIDHLPMTTVSVFDENLRCVTIGGHWIVRNNADPDSFVGRPISDFFSPADRDAGVAVYEAGLHEPQRVYLNLSTGQAYRFEVVPLTAPDGKRYVLSVAEDVTEARRTEIEREQMTTALAVSEASFREAFDGAPIGIALTSVQDSAHERFLRVNQAFAGLLGRPAEDFVNVPVADLTHPEDHGLRPDLSSEWIDANRLRKRFLHASGRAVWVEVSYAVVRDLDGRPSHVIEHIQDIRAIKESERALLDALEQQRATLAGLRDLDAMRREVVSTISHELRTPLTSIHGYLELLTDEALLPRQQQMVDVALRNALRLAGLVDNLLVLAKLESDDAPQGTPSGEIDVREVVQAAIDTIRPELAERRQRLEVHLDAAVAATTHGDAEQLHRAVLNLLTNASKYTASEGEIDVGLTTAGAQVQIAIRDSGIGIPVEEQDQLFGRFFRASTARDLAISGNGLGLAIVKSIVELHDGTISVESAPGRGSCFTLTLPLAAEARASAPAHAS